MNTKKMTPSSPVRGEIRVLPPGKGNWLDWERAELGRLSGSFPGPTYEVESGLSEDGDPWCVVTETASGRLVVHICRIAGKYTVASPEEKLLKSTGDIKVAIELAIQAT
ncbi:hypothetical protein [Bradyrhizobium sp. MOS002]|uniref:hypothetical protein n=1 Tax=Bradyrhizobium sp. MOS002 TaxID=2133947 RepID=UPI000D13A949|nr:hypothetical protein [Bradyrhizobium sp. MOS002]PSO23656.1 hypothetical protein C7G41_32485 [Bradyrhizobium sp. MOS002]